MKIGFIAMSGVRAHNTELTELGLTLPGFVERNKIIAALPSLGLLTLAALTPDRFEVDYQEIADLKQTDSLPTDYDLVAISSYSAQIFEAYQLADEYRRKGIPVVMGGLHVSALPEEAKTHCASAVVGEGEVSWPKLLADFEKGDLAPFYRQQQLGNFDLQDAPLPRFDLLDPGKYNRLTVQTSRGCPHQCDFCASSILMAPTYKLKPVPKVIAEIRAIKQIWDRPFIEFADDNSFVNKKHSRELLRAMVKEKVRWFTEADVSVADDPELLGLMRDSGCQQVLIGLESPRTVSLDGIELQANWKLKQREKYKEAVARIQSYGITVNGCFILGLDGDTATAFDEVLDFIRESNVYDAQITVLTAFPGTPLYGRLKQEKRIIRDGAWELCTLFDVNVVPKSMTVQELQNGFVGLAKTLYSDEETGKRRTKFREALKASISLRRKLHQ